MTCNYSHDSKQLTYTCTTVGDHYPSGADPLKSAPNSLPIDFLRMTRESIAASAWTMTPATATDWGLLQVSKSVLRCTLGSVVNEA